MLLRLQDDQNATWQMLNAFTLKKSHLVLNPLHEQNRKIESQRKHI
jgi:hypothetical protein